MTIIIEYKQNGSGEHHDDIGGVGGEFNHKILWENEYSLKIPCCNTLCKSNYSIGQEADAFAKSGQMEKTDYIICMGNESSPKSKKTYRRCANSLRYRFLRVVDTPQAEPE